MVTRPDRGQPPDYVEAVFTCQGDYYDPNFPHQLEAINRRLLDLLKADDEQLVIKKVEPWNSVKVTLNIPKEIAERLKSLASQNGGSALRNMGIMSLQMEGDRIIGLTLSKPSSHGLSGATASTSGAASSQPGSSSSSSNSLHHNLFNLPNNSSTKPHCVEQGLMQPPPNVVPPIVIPKPKPERRQRKGGTGSRARSSKSKTSVSTADTATTSSSGNASSQPTGVAMSSLPANLVTCTGTTTMTSSTPVSEVINHVMPHPALKDTKLSTLSTLPSSSIAQDGSDDRLIASELLACLFERSLANTKAANKLSPPQTTLMDTGPPPAHSSGRVLESEPKPSFSSQQSKNEIQDAHATTKSIPSPSSSSPRPVNLSLTSTQPHIEAETDETESSISIRSEHVSVIAGPFLTPGTSSPQQVAMDLSHNPVMSVNKSELQESSAETNDNEVAMDLSASMKTDNSPPTTPLTPPTSVPEQGEDRTEDNIENHTNQSVDHIIELPPATEHIQASIPTEPVEMLSLSEQLHTGTLGNGVESSASNEYAETDVQHDNKETIASSNEVEPPSECSTGQTEDTGDYAVDKQVLSPNNTESQTANSLDTNLESLTPPAGSPISPALLSIPKASAVIETDPEASESKPLDGDNKLQLNRAEPYSPESSQLITLSHNNGIEAAQSDTATEFNEPTSPCVVVELNDGDNSQTVELQQTVNSEPVEALHGKPVSVICSTIDTAKLASPEPETTHADTTELDSVEPVIDMTDKATLPHSEHAESSDTVHDQACDVNNDEEVTEQSKEISDSGPESSDVVIDYGIIPIVASDSNTESCLQHIETHAETATEVESLQSSVPESTAKSSTDDVDKTVIDIEISRSQSEHDTPAAEQPEAAIQSPTAKSEEQVKSECDEADIPKYYGPTPHHSLLTAIDQEPAENGSSTSTDSGVVTGSPKSDDVCPTPPSVEEPQSIKADADVEIMVMKSISSVSPSQTETTSQSTEEPAPIVSNAKVLIPPQPSVDMKQASTDSVHAQPNTNRPCVSILKNMAKPVQTKVITSENKIISKITPITTKVITPENKVFSASSQRLPQPVTQNTRPTDPPYSYLMNSQSNVSSMLVAAANAASNNRPSLSHAASNNRPYVIVPSNSQQQSHKRIGGGQQGGSIIINKANRNNISVPQLVISGNSVLLENRHPNDDRSDMTGQAFVRQSPYKEKVLPKPSYIISKDTTNNGGKLQIRTESNNPVLLKSMIIHSKESRMQHPTVITSNPVTTAMSIVTANNGPKPTTVIVSQLSATPTKTLHRIPHIVNLTSMPTMVNKLPVSKVGNVEPSSLKLPAVTIINSATVSPANSGSQPLPSQTSIAVSPLRSEHPSSIKTVVDTNLLASVNQGKAVANVVKVQGETRASDVTNNKQPSEEHKATISESKLLETKGTPEEPEPKPDLKGVIRKSDTDTEVTEVLVNGITDHDTHETESLHSGTNIASMSPSSVGSSLLEIQTTEAPVLSSAVPSLSSPTGQRKSGRVRTIKSPDPDYITPSRGRKRGPRQISEDSNNSEAVNVPAPTPKKVIKPSKVETTEAVPVAVPLANGPTSLKRSTRSSGVAEHQALPSGYRERKKPKR